ncbi:MAG: type II 3-dehydroquinate dehydratase [Turneriella sp.]|nr:type II 3-dehydroquinate dehydratase [Turneriella sp.]
MELVVANGPNLNLLGQREKEIYGSFTLQELEERIRAHIAGRAFVQFFQSNSEAALLDFIHALDKAKHRLILNAAGLTHTSVVLRDALAAREIPFIEVHISNVYAREKFRHRSYLAPLAKGVIAGFGMESYLLAVDYFLRNPG